MTTTTTEQCDACEQTFDTLAEVFSHDCPGLPASLHTPHATRRSDNVDAPERRTGAGGRWKRMGDKTNRYGGNCVKCGGYVPEGTGWLVKDNSAQRGGTVWGVEHKVGECAEQATEPKSELPADPDGIRPKQESYLRSLLERKQPQADADAVIEAIKAVENPRAMASAMIDTLKVEPDAPKPDRLEDGIYLVDGTVYKVYHTKHGANQQVAKELVTDDGEFTMQHGETKRPVRFEYRGKAPLRKINPEHRMTLEQAKEFGAVYGVCCNCGATLTDETGIEQGIGPVCAKRFA